MHRTYWILLVVAVVCSSARGAECKAPEQQQQAVRISRDEFFSGELKRLEHHLGWQTGCLRLRYDGPEVPMRLVFQRWRNGQSEDLAIIGTKIVEDTEVRFSIQDAVKEGKPAYKVVVETVGVLNSLLVPNTDRPFQVSLRQELFSDLEVSIPGETVVWVWIQHADTIWIHEPLERLAKEHDWALTLKLAFGSDPEFPDGEKKYMITPVEVK